MHMRNDCDNELYEVESIFDDEMVQTRRFFVRWTGYHSSHDSGMYEKDLNCPRIFKKYFQSKNS